MLCCWFWRVMWVGKTWEKPSVFPSWPPWSICKIRRKWMCFARSTQGELVAIRKIHWLFWPAMNQSDRRQTFRVHSVKPWFQTLFARCVIQILAQVLLMASVKTIVIDFLRHVKKNFWTPTPQALSNSQLTPKCPLFAEMIRFCAQKLAKLTEE